MALCSLDFFSNALLCDNQIQILLPEKRRGETVDTGDKKYPVLYCLHGNGDDSTAWMRKSNIELLTRNSDIIVVMPSTQMGFYTDTKYHMDYFTFISEELPVIVGNYFPVAAGRENTFVIGNSMGGYGAFKLALTFPDRYAGAASLSGAMEPYQVVKENIRETKTVAKFIDIQKSIFGETADFEGSENDLFHLVKQLDDRSCEQPLLYQCCGQQDRITGAFNQRFHKYVQEQCSNLNYEYYEGLGGHCWEYWNPQIETAIKKFGLL